MQYVQPACLRPRNRTRSAAHDYPTMASMGSCLADSDGDLPPRMVPERPDCRRGRPCASCTCPHQRFLRVQADLRWSATRLSAARAAGGHGGTAAPAGSQSARGHPERHARRDHIGDGLERRQERLPGGVPRRHQDLQVPDSGSRGQAGPVRLERRQVLRPAGHPPHQRRGLPAHGHQRCGRAYAGGPAAGLQHRYLQRRDDGLCRGLGGLRPRRRHLVGLRSGGATRHPPHPARSHHGVPQR